MTSRALSETLGFAVSGPLSTLSLPSGGHTETGSAPAAPLPVPPLQRPRRGSQRPPEHVAQGSGQNFVIWRWQSEVTDPAQGPRSASWCRGCRLRLRGVQWGVTENPLHSIVSPPTVSALSLASAAAATHGPPYHRIYGTRPHIQTLVSQALQGRGPYGGRTPSGNCPRVKVCAREDPGLAVRALRPCLRGCLTAQREGKVAHGIRWPKTITEQ